MESHQIEKVDCTLDDNNIMKELANCCETLQKHYSSYKIVSNLINYAIELVYQGIKPPDNAREYLMCIVNERHKERQGR